MLQVILGTHAHKITLERMNLKTTYTYSGLKNYLDNKFRCVWMWLHYTPKCQVKGCTVYTGYIPFAYLNFADTFYLQRRSTLFCTLNWWIIQHCLCVFFIVDSCKHSLVGHLWVSCGLMQVQMPQKHALVHIVNNQSNWYFSWNVLFKLCRLSNDYSCCTAMWSKL